MLSRGLVDPQGLRDAFAEVRAQLFRFPAIDQRGSATRVDGAIERFEAGAPPA